MFAMNGWLAIIVIYAALAMIIGALLYGVIRLAVTHALKAHTLWLDGRGESSST
jgi:hypothetical protein